ncbi:hypothetical protein C8Q70DRAFT_962497 [Cubamyces menziesii]|nr:hypothetical protein C8Q70DRAFT_962497 [Cubamyces menziesii]
MKLTFFSVLATSLTLVAARAVARDDSDPAHGKILEPAAGAHIAPGAAFNFTYQGSGDYCRSSYAYSVWLITDMPTSFAPVDVFTAGHFFGRYDLPNYPGEQRPLAQTRPMGALGCDVQHMILMPLPSFLAVPYPKNPAPPQLTMPDFSVSPGGFGPSQTATNKTVQLAVLEEWAGCEIDVSEHTALVLTSALTSTLGAARRVDESDVHPRRLQRHFFLRDDLFGLLFERTVLLDTGTSTRTWYLPSQRQYPRRRIS